MKTTFFVLLTALSLTACAKDDKATKPSALIPVAAAAFTKTAQADDKKPAPRLNHRMQLAPVTADKFVLARKD